MSDQQDVEIGPAGIRLGQFLKYVNAVETGGEVKDLLASGGVSVNGAVEQRRGAQLSPGDTVTAAGTTYSLT